MIVKDRPTDSVRPYPNNPRHNDDAVPAVMESIKRFGFKQPIVVDMDGTIIVGHTRHKAALALGLKTIPVVVADNLTPEQVNAYRLADNKVAELASWDIELLDRELEGLLKSFDMEDFGFEIGAPEMPELSTEEDRDGYVSVFLRMDESMHEEFMQTVDMVTYTRYTDGTRNANKVLEVVRQWAELSI